jgi:hypothetical protein
MGYKVLGYVAWKWYLPWRLRRARRLAEAALVGAVVVALAAAAARRR